jgi:hypothetical protein
MKKNLAVAAMLLCALYSTKGEPQANAVQGVIRRAGQNNRPFGKDEAMAEVRNRSIKDSTDTNGRYGLAVPKELRDHQVLYSASGYYSAKSKPLSNDSASQKLDDVALTPMTIGNTIWRETERFRFAINTEIMVYRESIFILTRIEYVRT